MEITFFIAMLMAQMVREVATVEEVSMFGAEHTIALHREECLSYIKTHYPIDLLKQKLEEEYPTDSKEIVAIGTAIIEKMADIVMRAK